MKQTILFLAVFILIFSLQAVAIDEIEPNNKNPQSIVIPTTISGSISTSNNDSFDWFEFTVDEPIKISLGVEALSDEFISFNLYRKAFNKLQTLAESMSRGGEINSINTLLKPGKYLILIFNAPDSDNLAYTLNVTTPPIGQNPQLSLLGKDTITLSATKRNTTKIFVDAFNFTLPTKCTVDPVSTTDNSLRITPKKFLLSANKNSQILKATVPRATALNLINSGSSESEVVVVNVSCENGVLEPFTLFLSSD